ncbi:MAG TPA: hypothetical protein VG097_07140 [Gemmata sp.]|jgi:hypothetical protein|nr:hypothetical protein [Gemmata sp.]
MYKSRNQWFYSRGISLDCDRVKSIKVLFVTILFVTGISCVSRLTDPLENDAKDDSESGLDEIDEFSKLCDKHKWGEEDPEYCKMARRLVREQKWEIINAIFASSRFNYFKTFVAGEVVAASDTTDAIAFLRTLPKNENTWHMAMLSLSSKGDRAVKAYVLEVAADKDPGVRSTCYCICGTNRWPDLLEQARADSTSIERYFPQYDVSCGLADAAKSYRVELRDLPKGTPIELPRRLKIPDRPKDGPLFPEDKP